ncbi:hypothetical protein [Nonomuraea sp. NPDC003754]
MLLKEELGKLGIYADVNQHCWYGGAAVPGRGGWARRCNGQRDYRWTRVYAVFPADDVESTARRVAQRYAEQREAEPLIGLAEHLA